MPVGKGSLDRISNGVKKNEEKKASAATENSQEASASKPVKTTKRLTKKETASPSTVETPAPEKEKRPTQISHIACELETYLL